MAKPIRVLVIDSDSTALDRIRKCLQREGLAVSAFSDYGLAWDAYVGMQVGLVIADGGPSGIQFCRRLRGIDQLTPIMFVVERKHNFNTRKTLDMGCDDYILKPVDTHELAVRVHLVLERVERIERVILDRTRRKVIEIGELVIDSLKRLVYVSGESVPITVTEFNILNLLASNRGRTYSRRELLNLLWDDEAEVFEHTVNSHINRLRAKIEKDPRSPKYILTVWGIGYRFSEEER
jgi:two-component system alkaline phosphatase synthesis response regulator PhoP